MEAFVRFLKPLTGLLVFGFLAWYFSDLLAYIVISAVLSILGRPLVQIIQSIHIGRVKLNNTIGAVLTLFTYILLFSLFILFIVPLITDQASMISSCLLYTSDAADE